MIKTFAKISKRVYNKNVSAIQGIYTKSVGHQSKNYFLNSGVFYFKLSFLIFKSFIMINSSSKIIMLLITESLPF